MGPGQLSQAWTVVTKPAWVSARVKGGAFEGTNVASAVKRASRLLVLIPLVIEFQVLLSVHAAIIRCRLTALVLLSPSRGERNRSVTD